MTMLCLTKCFQDTLSYTSDHLLHDMGLLTFMVYIFASILAFSLYFSNSQLSRPCKNAYNNFLLTNCVALPRKMDLKKPAPGLLSQIPTWWGWGAPHKVPLNWLIMELVIWN